MPFAISEGARIFYRLEGAADRPLLVLVHSLGVDHVGQHRAGVVVAAQDVVAVAHGRRVVVDVDDLRGLVHEWVVRAPGANL